MYRIYYITFDFCVRGRKTRSTAVVAELSPTVVTIITIIWIWISRISMLYFSRRQQNIENKRKYVKPPTITHLVVRRPVTARRSCGWLSSLTRARCRVRVLCRLPPHDMDSRLNSLRIRLRAGWCFRLRTTTLLERPTGFYWENSTLRTHVTFSCSSERRVIKKKLIIKPIEDEKLIILIMTIIIEKKKHWSQTVYYYNNIIIYRVCVFENSWK